ncbi:MAG: glycosyltransferase [Candidatus Daviesbacteria bacterium]|nr:glycosyltransferase [Candidatus Daviesbacteria bacterium]
MRILLSLIISFIFFFYIGELVATINRKIPLIKRIFPISHSVIGLILTMAGVFIGFFAGSDSIKTLTTFIAIGAGLGLIVHHILSKNYFLFENAEHAFAKRHEKGIDRLLEIFPGTLTWLALTSPLWLSYTLPFAVAYIILIADIYWLFNACKIAILIYIGYKKMNYAKKQNWLQKLDQDFPDEWKEYYHLFVIPTYKESLEVLKPAFDAIINSNYPKDKIFLSIGLEQRDDPKKIAEVQHYCAVNSDKIGGCFVTVHPYGLPGEIAGPATNRNFIIINATKEFAKIKIDPSKVIVTTLDADFVVHPQFLAGMMHKYLATPVKERLHRSYTGVFLYYNNYWQAPAPMRLIATGTAFWQLAEMVGSDKYMNFSSLSMNLSSLLDIGLWIPDKVNDDSGFYWKAYFHYNGHYKVIPHYMPITADAVLDTTILKTFQNQYLQLKRWAYGVEHMPFIIKSYFNQKDIDFWNKTDKVLFKIWGDFKWGTLALFVTFAGLLIPLVNPHYNESAVAYNLPVVSSYILTGAFFGLFATIFVHEKTVPPRPKSWNALEKLWSYIQWVLIPVIMVSISALPAIDAQTRLMFGNYMEFRTTVKARTKE